MKILLLLALAVPNATTPGVAHPLTRAQVCSTKWGADHRHVTPAMRRQVLKNYGLTSVVGEGKGACCEVDHKVPRELGGADDVANLWPQPWVEARMKDRDENLWHKNVCRGAETLYEAQQYFLHWGGT